jgi:tetratricopeptide (TPR) repeat protein
MQEEIGDRKGVAFSLNNIGMLQIEIEGFKIASKYLNRALKKAVELGEKEILRRVHISLAELCLQTKEYDEVKHHLKSAFTLADELGFKQGKGEALLISARLGSLKGKIDKDVFEECISIFEQSNNPFALAKAYYYYTKALSACSSKPAADSKGKKEKCKAESYLIKAEEIFKKIGAKLWLNRVKKLWQKIRGNRSVQRRS